jgi:hypothetical protein
MQTTKPKGPQLQVATVPAWISPTPLRRSGQPAGPAACRWALARRGGVRGHQPHRRPSPARPPGRVDPRALGHRGAAPPPRCHLRRGRLPGPHRHRPTGHGQPAQPLAIAILRLHGDRNIAAALRRNARDATRVLPLLGITSP